MNDKGKLVAALILVFSIYFGETAFAQKKRGPVSPEKNSANASENNKRADEENRNISDNKEHLKADEKTKDFPPVSYKLLRGEKELMWEAGTSPFNPSNFWGPKQYDVYGRDLHLSSFRFGRVLGTKKQITFQYFFSASPVAVFTKNEVKNPRFVSKDETPDQPPTIRETSWGFGIQPLNFRFLFLPESRIKPFAQVGGGFLVTNKAVPVPYSRNFNFTGDFGGGVQYFTSRRKAVTFGYKYFHISNGNVGGKIRNPGYNANVFYIGYSVFYK